MQLHPFPPPAAATPLPGSRPFHQVDVFTATPYFGNPLAVVHAAQGLNDAQMQRFARWTNLSETTFLMPPSPEAAAAGADYQVRIFTPAYEMPFAGHPTLGSCHAWLDAGGVPRDPHCIVQQCKVGLVKIRRSEATGGHRLAFAAPALSRTAPSAQDRTALARALGLQPQSIVDAQHLHNGPRHLGFLVDSVETVLSVKPDPYALTQALHDAGVTGVGLAALYGANAPGLLRPDLEIRFFAMHPALVEDPVTGSFNASMAQWLMAEGYAPTRYVAAQGSCIGNAGRVFAERDDGGQVWIGGDTVTCIRGEVLL